MEAFNGLGGESIIILDYLCPKHTGLLVVRMNFFVFNKQDLFIHRFGRDNEKLFKPLKRIQPSTHLPSAKSARQHFTITLRSDLGSAETKIR